MLAETEIANERWLDDGELGLERQLFLREMIARYAFALGLKWNLSEENDYSVEFLRETSDYIASLDWTDKPVSVHNQIDDFSDYESLLGEPTLAATSIQYAIESAGDIVEEWRQRSEQAGRPWVVDMDENATGLSPDNAALLRKQALYDIYFSGGNIEWNLGLVPLPVGGDVNVEDFRTREQMWRFTRIAREFMEQHLPFWEMNPADDLVSGELEVFGGAEVFAKAGAVYAVYLPEANTGSAVQLDLSVAEGELFERHWFNPQTGTFEGRTESVVASASSPIGEPPSRSGEDWVILFTRSAAAVADNDTGQEGEINEFEVNDNTSPAAPSTESEEVVEIEQNPVENAVQVSDNGIVNEEDMPNSPPQISELADSFFVESGIPIEFTVSATDSEGQIPALYLLDAPAGSEFNDNGNGTRTFVWLPDDADTGTHGITVVAEDALDSNLRDVRELVVNVTVPRPVEVSQVPDSVAIALSATGDTNQPPELNIPDGSAIPVGTAIDLVFLPIDPEGVVPSLTIEQLPQGASFVDNGNGTRSIQWTPQSEDRGSYPLVLVVADGRNPQLTSSHEFLLEIVAASTGDTAVDPIEPELTRAPANQAPIFLPLAEPEIMVGEQLQLNVLPRDPEGLAPVLHVQNAPETSSFEDSGNGGRQLMWTPDSDCLLYTSPSPRDATLSRMPSSA